MSKIKPTRLKANETRVTVTVERRDEPTVSFSHIPSKWSLDVGVNPYSMELSTTGKRPIVREAR